MNYNYNDVNGYAKACGIFLLPEKLAEFDQLAFAHGFTQAQVNVALQVHIRHVAWLFDPSHFTFKQRIVLALHFLIGRKRK